MADLKQIEEELTKQMHRQLKAREVNFFLESNGLVPETFTDEQFQNRARYVMAKPRKSKSDCDFRELVMISNHLNIPLPEGFMEAMEKINQPALPVEIMVKWHDLYNACSFTGRVPCEMSQQIFGLLFSPLSEAFFYSFVGLFALQDIMDFDAYSLEWLKSLRDFLNTHKCSDPSYDYSAPAVLRLDKYFAKVEAKATKTEL